MAKDNHFFFILRDSVGQQFEQGTAEWLLYFIMFRASAEKSSDLAPELNSLKAGSAGDYQWKHLLWPPLHEPNVA